MTTTVEDRAAASAVRVSTELPGSSPSGAAAVNGEIYCVESTVSWQCGCAAA